MAAPKGNKFAQGNKGGGRKGYEFESQQLKRMSKILNGMLTLTEKMLKKTASPGEQLNYENLMRMTMKIMDKLHANRQTLEIEPRGEGLKELTNFFRIMAEGKKKKKND